MVRNRQSHLLITFVHSYLPDVLPFAVTSSTLIGLIPHLIAALLRAELFQMHYSINKGIFEHKLALHKGVLNYFWLCKPISYYKEAQYSRTSNPAKLNKPLFLPILHVEHPNRLEEFLLCYNKLNWPGRSDGWEKIVLSGRFKLGYRRVPWTTDY